MHEITNGPVWPDAAPAGRVVSQASRESVSALRLPGIKTHCDMLEAAIADAMRHGAPNVTRKEARERMARMFADADGRPLWLEMNVIAARVGELLAAGRVLVDRKNLRPCAISGRRVETLTVPAAQVRLLA